jgi:hypothetical protein
VYEFAIVVLLGIGSFKLIDMVNEYFDVSKFQTVLTIGLGILVAWALDFSLFAAWNEPIRNAALGYVGTGLMIAAAGYALPQVLHHVADVIGIRRGEVRKAA